MRGLAVVLIFLIFGLTFPIAVFTYSLGTIANPDYVKTQLDGSEIYQVAADQVPILINRGEEEDNTRVQDPITEELQKIVLEEVNGRYLQGKVEPFVDQTFSWLARERNEPPQMSFVDLLETAENQIGQPVPGDVEETFSKPLEWNPDNAEQLKDGYGYFKLAPIVFGSISAILIVLLFLLVQGWRAKLRRVALCIFLPTFFGFLGAGVGLFAGQVLSGLVSGVATDSPIPELEEPVKELIVNISQDLTKTLVIIYAVSLAVAIVLFVASFFVERKSKLEKAIKN